MTALDERPAVHGPYETFMDVDGDIDSLFFVGKPGDGVRSAVEVEALTRDMLLATLERCGVTLGDYEREAADLLSVLDPHLVQVWCGWLERANLGPLLAEVTRLRRELEFTQKLAADANLRITRCVHGGCVETGLRPLGSPFACESHKGPAVLVVDGVAEVLTGPSVVRGRLGIVHEIEGDEITLRFGDDVLVFPSRFLRPRPDADPAGVEASHL